ncbi:MAG: N-acetyltransferase [Herpetosiphonaceae bacterium]|nr:N-acetyltransferase [Herpetosiphonaceae bacterium]
MITSIDVFVPQRHEPEVRARVRRASVEDVEAMAGLINGYAADGLMLPKTLAQLYNNVRDFVVAEADGQVVGCAGLKVTWRDLSEIVSLAVAPAYQGQGLGRRLVEPLIKEAQTLRIPTVFALTYQVPFFTKLGFLIVPKDTLSQKVWQDCVTCPKQSCCDEIAMVRVLQKEQ